MFNSLWIMRHGLAESEFDTDFNRALSETGKQQAVNVCQQIMCDGIALPTRMLVSPFRRTQETAAVVHSSLNFETQYETEQLLVHSADPQLLGEYLLTLNGDIMLVSHMPIVAKLCQYLLPGCDIYGFQTAQLVILMQAAQNQLVVSKIYLAE